MTFVPNFTENWPKRAENINGSLLHFMLVLWNLSTRCLITDCLHQRLMYISWQEPDELVNISKNSVFWDVAQCRFCVNRCFRGNYRLHFKVEKSAKEKPAWADSDIHVATKISVGRRNPYPLQPKFGPTALKYFTEKQYLNFHPSRGLANETAHRSVTKSSLWCSICCSVFYKADESFVKIIHSAPLLPHFLLACTERYVSISIILYLHISWVAHET
jgi:hypothetical protein